MRLKVGGILKKKIVFILTNMNIGGTEKALLNMVTELPEDKYEVTILMLENYGGFLPLIPKKVKIEFFSEYKNIKSILNNPPHMSALEFLKKGKFINAFIIILLHLITKIIKNRSLFFGYLLKDYPKVYKKYDIAVAYDGPMDFISYFLFKKIPAEKKIQWIHFDISKIGFNRYFASKIYRNFDKVYVVSKEGRNKLVNLIPSLKDKTEVFSNIISPSLIYSQAKIANGFNDQFSGIRILTVGRLAPEKGQDIAIRVLTKLIKNDFNVKWYCVGGGNLRDKYEKLIKENDVKERFVLLGAVSNPYPYIYQCDIYVQPSRHEGYCITLAEARCLKKPIITTDFTGAREQIKNGETGLIVNCKENEIYDAVIKLINNPKLRSKFSGNLGLVSVDSTQEITKIIDL